MLTRTQPIVTFATLHITADLDTSQQDRRHPTLRELNTTLRAIQRALDLGWTGIPLDWLLEEHEGPIPALPRYELLTVKMASPLEIVMGIPRDVAAIPLAVAGLTLAIERVLNCKARVLARREGLEADRAEALDRRLAAEVRIKDRLDASREQTEPERASRLHVRSAEILIESG